LLSAYKKLDYIRAQIFISGIFLKLLWIKINFLGIGYLKSIIYHKKNIIKYLKYILLNLSYFILYHEIQKYIFVVRIIYHKISPLVMRFFTFLLFPLLLLFGVALEGYGQGGPGGGGGSGGGVNVDCEECRPANNQRDNFVIQEAYLSNGTGDRLGIDDCISGDEFWITLAYTSRQELDNVKLLFELLIKNNSNQIVNSVEIEYFEGLVESTGPGEQKTVTIQVSLPSGSFNCNNQVLELFNTRAFWTANSNLNPNGTCGGYAPGLCSNPPLVIIPVGVNGFIYDFDYVFDCINETDSDINVTFFVTTLAGGTRPATINWSFLVNGTPEVVDPNGEFSYTIENVSPDDEIIPTLVINNRPSDNPFTVPPKITVPPLFDIIDDTIVDNDPNITPSPNGSITIEEIDPADDEYLFIWTDIDGNFLDPVDPRNLTGLGAGDYTLTLINQDTGICRIFTFEIGASILPVLYGDLSLDFINPKRIVEFNWSTTKEWESSHFEVERATQGIQFEKIGEVKSAGWSDIIMEYAFEDKQLPLTGGNLLYRLKQVDLDGKYDYSKVLSVRIPGVEFSSGVWRAYPNPTDGNALRINLMDASQYNDETITFRLFHPT
jgi:hypothetical protein